MEGTVKFFAESKGYGLLGGGGRVKVKFPWLMEGKTNFSYRLSGGHTPFHNKYRP